MTDKRWKAIERWVADIFGAPYRRPTSGSHDHHADGGVDDIVHPLLHIEVKHTQRPPGNMLWKKTRRLAKKIGKTPLVFIHEKGQDLEDGYLWVRPKDLLEVALIYELASDQRAMMQLEEAKTAPPIKDWIPTFSERFMEKMVKLTPIMHELLKQQDMRGALDRYIKARVANQTSIPVTAISRHDGAWNSRYVTCRDCQASYRADSKDMVCPVCGSQGKLHIGGSQASLNKEASR